MAFRRSFLPDVLDPPIRTDQHAAAHDTQKRFTQKTFHAPGPVGFDGLEVRIAQQGKVQLQFFPEFAQGGGRVCAAGQDGGVQGVEFLFCVAKLGRFVVSTRRVRFDKEKQQHAPACEVFQADLRSVVIRQAEQRGFLAHLQSSHRTPRRWSNCSAQTCPGALGRSTLAEQPLRPDLPRCPQPINPGGATAPESR